MSTSNPISNPSLGATEAVKESREIHGLALLVVLQLVPIDKHVVIATPFQVIATDVSEFAPMSENLPFVSAKSSTRFIFFAFQALGLHLSRGSFVRGESNRGAILKILQLNPINEDIAMALTLQVWAKDEAVFSRFLLPRDIAREF